MLTVDRRLLEGFNSNKGLDPYKRFYSLSRRLKCLSIEDRGLYPFSRLTNSLYVYVKRKKRKSVIFGKLKSSRIYNKSPPFGLVDFSYESESLNKHTYLMCNVTNMKLNPKPKTNCELELSYSIVENTEGENSIDIENHESPSEEIIGRKTMQKDCNEVGIESVRWGNASPGDESYMKVGA